ncbi:MAG: phosphatase PAP2 family protein [Myxococcota bacterium]|nr:phosphatase PAP2 family protein [Myxococcota bacterium]
MPGKQGEVRRLCNHLRRLWPGWSVWAPLPFVLHASWAAARGGFHWENAVVLVVVLTLFAVGPRTKRLLVGAYPLGLVGVLYDAMKLVEYVGVSPSTVHVCDLRDMERALFGVTVNGARGTLHDWFQAHALPCLDALCAIPYATFIFVCGACAIWLYARDYARMVRFAWCFFALNVAGFVTYHVFPAAPPWYYHLYGCRVDLLAPASEGPNLARVDARLGLHYFAAMYGRASDVFGAMPSLHVAYALIVVLEGWACMRNGWRGASIAFFVAMCFSAVYLDHHWVLDVIAGVIYCLLVVGAARRITRLRPVQGAPEAGAPGAQPNEGAP